MLLEDQIRGGRADNRQPGEFDEEELAVGRIVEREHVDSDEQAEEIAMDHLAEHPNYYSTLYRAGLVDEDKAIEKITELGWDLKSESSAKALKDFPLGYDIEAEPGEEINDEDPTFFAVKTEKPTVIGESGFEKRLGHDKIANGNPEKLGSVKIKRIRRPAQRVIDDKKTEKAVTRGLVIVNNRHKYIRERIQEQLSKFGV